MPKLPTENEKNGGLEAPAITWLYVILAGLVTLSGSFTNFLNHHAYPLFRLEVLATFAILTLATVIVAALYLVSSQYVRRFLEALLITILVDIHFLHNFSHSLFFLAVIFAALTFLRRSVLKVLTIFGILVLAITLVSSLFANEWPMVLSNQVRQAREGQTPPIIGKPAIVHVILDEHIGFGGFPDTPPGQDFQSRLTSHYLDRGFRIYPRAYSQHLHTINAIPSILNFGEGKAVSANFNGMVLGPTRLFDEMIAQDYRLSIFQSGFGDYCTSTETFRCVEYDHESLAPTLRVPMNTSDRTRLMIAKFSKLSEIVYVAQQVPSFVSRIIFGSGSPITGPALVDTRSSPIAALTMFDVVAHDIESIRPGDAVFFHALFPHYPFATTADCAVKPLDAWRLRRDRTSLEERQGAYNEQLECATTQLDRIVSALDSSPAAGNYVLIVHGDHGSRITRHDPLAHQGDYLAEDLTAAFSTMMAIKIVGQQGGVDNSLAPAASIIQDLVFKEFKSFPDINSVRRPAVILDNERWVPDQNFELPDDLFSPIDPADFSNDMEKNNDL